MSDDPYTLLGVAKTASPDDIRKAYRKLAKQLHPDLNPGDTAAEDRFKQVAGAYHLLNDPEQRARFDRGEIDAAGAERQQQPFYRDYAEGAGGERYHRTSGYQDFEDVSDIFSDLFRQRQAAGGGDPRSGTGGGQTFRMRGRDARYHLQVAFLEAANGAKSRITLPDGQPLDLTIPAGSKDGDTLRLKGKGGEGLGGGEPGDALVEIAVTEHPVFRREGDDILLDLPITLDEAVLGGKVEVPTISGRVTMTIPKGADSGDVLRLKGKGVSPVRRPAGDQRVVLRVTMPETIDEELATFMESWRTAHRYDPRATLRRST